MERDCHTLPPDLVNVELDPLDDIGYDSPPYYYSDKYRIKDEYSTFNNQQQQSTISYQASRNTLFPPSTLQEQSFSPFPESSVLINGNYYIDSSAVSRSTEQKDKSLHRSLYPPEDSPLFVQDASSDCENAPLFNSASRANETLLPYDCQYSPNEYQQYPGHASGSSICHGSTENEQTALQMHENGLISQASYTSTNFVDRKNPQKKKRVRHSNEYYENLDKQQKNTIKRELNKISAKDWRERDKIRRKEIVDELSRELQLNEALRPQYDALLQKTDLLRECISRLKLVN